MMLDLKSVKRLGYQSPSAKLTITYEALEVLGPLKVIDSDFGYCNFQIKLFYALGLDEFHPRLMKVASLTPAKHFCPVFRRSFDDGKLLFDGNEGSFTQI
ncbi:hypothetical protein CLF_101895 [Clonorchis sinensis]|uniref:Uncharacterized protein n=1 Tax=Clonorchis sinensis TaxID=79923 RepID=G7Y6T6_CLOSI|nr:hypothetical protein CLF_101895 [Clonorchis sinensis]